MDDESREFDFDYSTNPNAHLRQVMGDDYDPGVVIEHSEDVHVVRVESERNLWELAVDGEGVATFAPELSGTSDALAAWIDARAARARSDDEEQSDAADEKGWSGSFQ